MTPKTNHWKLGLFVVLGVVLALSTVGLLSARSMRKETGNYVSYFDESVQGLEVGSPIKFRGVIIGTVGKIDVAPDHRHVEVTSELGKKELSRLGLDVVKGQTQSEAPKKLVQAIGLRAQLASSGLTGVKFLQLDFFPVADNPRPELPFAVPHNYIPATSSTLKDLENSLLRTMNSLPKITEQVTRVVGRVDKIVAKLEDRRLIEQVVEVVEAARLLIGEARRGVAGLGTARLSAALEQTLTSFGELGLRASGILGDIDSDKGLLQSLKRASNAFGDTARNADGLGGQLADALRAVEQAAKSINKLASALELEPDMLLKGRKVQP